jgi:AraC-like DNA-binding protein
MKETLFVFDERNYQNCQQAFRGARSQEYYLGDYSIEGGSVIDVRADKKGVGCCSIIRLTSRTRLTFRRSWYHIREDATDVTVFWFVKRGRICVSHQSGHSVAKAGDFLITKSMTPFFIECQPDDESMHEVLHVVVPTHVVRRFIPHEVKTGFAVSAAGRSFIIAEYMLTDIFEDAGELAEPVAQLLLDAALCVLSDAVKGRDVAPVRQSVSDRRLQDVLTFIEIHISDPKLSIATVAKACGISHRYLLVLLQTHGTPFSKLIWEKRLKMASRWLASSQPGDVSVCEIAYRVGFKSAPHFSRMFKQVFKMSPSDYRSSGARCATKNARRIRAPLPTHPVRGNP